MSSKTTCWFCGESLNQRGRPINRHHILPRRFFGSKRDADFDNVAYAHVDCHQAWHCRFDTGERDFHRYMAMADPLAFGRGIFAPERIAAAA